MVRHGMIWHRPTFCSFLSYFPPTKFEPYALVLPLLESSDCMYLVFFAEETTVGFTFG